METPLMSNDNSNQNVKPKSYLTESILVTIFCCLPFGIVSIVNAANVESRWNAGDFVGSISASAAAKKWMKIGLFAGIAVLIISVGIQLIVGIGLMTMMDKQ